MSDHDRREIIGGCVMGFFVLVAALAAMLASFGPVVIFGGVP